MFEEVFPNLFAFYATDYSANSYLLVGKKTVLIDTGLKSGGPALKDSLSAVGFEPEDIDALLLTHGHSDHFGASYLFPNAEKYMHKFDATYVNIKDVIFTAAARLNNLHFPRITKNYEIDSIIDVAPFKLKVLSTPGHTKGSVCFYDEKNKLLFSGDTIFNGSVGRHDLPSGSKLELIDSLKKLKKLDFDYLFPGHGLMLKEGQDENIKKGIEMLSQ